MRTTSALLLLACLGLASAATQDRKLKGFDLRASVDVNTLDFRGNSGDDIKRPDPAAGLPDALSPAFVVLNNVSDTAGASCPSDPSCFGPFCSCPKARYLPIPVLIPDTVNDNSLELDRFLTELGDTNVLASFRRWLTLPWTPRGLVFNQITTEWSDWQTLCVKVSQAPVDILFLADTTGSMGPYLSAVKSNAVSMFNSLSSTLSNLQIGVAAYKDLTDTYAYKRFTPIQSMTSATFSTVLNANWSPSGGYDWPEAQLNALHLAAVGTGADATGWRASSIKIIVWFGDAPGHDTSNGNSLASVKADLLSVGIKVIALDCANLNYPGYSTSPQASYLAAQTAGFYGTVSSYTIAASIISSVANVAVTIKPVVSCPLNVPFIIEFNPSPTTTATPLRPGCFSIRIKACDAEDCAPAGHYLCNVTFVDVSNNQVIDVKPIIINTLPGNDTIAPSFAYVPASPITLECPARFECPPLRLVDNCDKPISVTPTVVVDPNSNSCNTTTTCTYEGKDAAGNVATPVQLVTYVVDTQPPVMSSTCAAGAICTSATSYCFETDRFLRNCYRDSCNDVIKRRFECQGCYNRDGTAAPGMDCKEDGNTFCVTFRPDTAGANRPRCCSIYVTVSDKCGNTQTTLQKICYAPKGTASPYQCLPDTFLRTPTVVDTGATFSNSRLP